MNEHTKKLYTYVGMRLLEKRKKRRFSLAYVAQRVNMSPQQLQKYERAHSMLSGSRLYQLADVLRVDVNYFFEGFSEFEARMTGQSGFLRQFTQRLDTLANPRTDVEKVCPL